MYNTKYFKTALNSILRFMLCKYKNVNNMSHQFKKKKKKERNWVIFKDVEGDEEEIRLERVISWVSILFEGQDKFNPSLLISLS